MRSKSIEEYKRKLKLNKELKEIIVGTLLGDGTLETCNRGRTYRLKIEHCLKQKDYVDWLYEKLRDFTGTRPKVRVRIDKGKKNFRYGFSTFSCGNFRFFGKQFYNEEGKRRIPKIIKKLLTPRAMAVWFMDDGSIKSLKHKGFVIHTLNFSRKDLKLLQRVLKEKFNLETRLHRQKKYRKTRWRIYIPGFEREKFLKLIQPYLLPIFMYKIGPTKLPKR